MLFFFFNDTATTEIYTLSLHDALPIFGRRARRATAHPGRGAQRRRTVRRRGRRPPGRAHRAQPGHQRDRSEEHTSELQSRQYLVCRLLLEKKNERAIVVFSTILSRSA